MTDAAAQLETKYIFIDAQVFVRERFDWGSKSLSRIKELVKSSHLRVLTTSITKNEVANKIREALGHTLISLKKHEVLLDQLGIATSPVSDAEAKPQTLFEDFLREVNAKEVPLSANLDDLIDDYFTQRPPFSAKKKSEFPDAIVIASLREFSSKVKEKIYVVSGDHDLKECCVEGGSLIHAESLGDVISKATVTQSFHDSLLQFLANSDHLKNELSASLKHRAVRVTGLNRFSDHLEVEASVSDVSDLSVHHLSVISQNEHETFYCEIDFEAYLWIDFEIDVGVISTGGAFNSLQHLIESEGIDQPFLSAEVTVEFYPANPEKSEIVAVYCDPDIEIPGTEIDALRPFR